jgi:hypothetical protein
VDVVALNEPTRRTDTAPDGARRANDRTARPTKGTGRSERLPADQKAASDTSISELSIDSAIARRADSSGSTVVAKNRATAGLPS